MNDVGRDFDQRNQHKTPLMQPGMRHFQTLLADDHSAIEEQIQVDHPRAPPFPSYASHFFFHAQKESE